MAKKPTITNVSTGYQATATINNNFTALRDGFDNTISRDGSTPNAMAADLDMNSNRVINLPAPISDNEPARLVDLQQAVIDASSIGVIPDGSITNAKLSSMARYRTKARTTLGSGAPEDLTSLQMKTVLGLEPTAWDYGMLGDGSTNDTTASAAVPEGAAIDGLNRTYVLTALPTKYQLYNATVSVSGVKYKMPSKKKVHPLDNSEIITVTKSNLNAHQLGGIWHDTTENRIYRVYVEGYTHAPQKGGIIYLDYSEDGGQTFIGRRSIYSAQDASIDGCVAWKMASTRVGILFGKSVSSRSTHFMYTDVDPSEAEDSDWVVTDIGAGLTYPAQFIFQGMYNWPTSLGGDNTEGFLTLNYTNNNIIYLRTNDNGDTWSDGILFNGSSTGTATAGSSNTITLAASNPYNTNWFSTSDLMVGANITITSGTGSGQSKRIQSYNSSTRVVTVTSNWTTSPDNTSVYSIEGPNEAMMAKVSGEDKWIIVARGAARFMVHTTLDMISVSGAWTDSTIVSRNSTITVGDTFYFVEKYGSMWFYIPRRENWTADTTRENTLMVYSEPSTTLYNNKTFSDNTGIISCYLPSRAQGEIRMAELPEGLAALVRAGEYAYPTSGDAIVNQMIMIVPYRVAVASPAIVQVPNKNIFNNGTFNLWRRGTSFTSITTTGTPTADRWRINPSGSTFSCSREAIDTRLSRSLPWRPAYGMRMTNAIGNDYAGFEQGFFGEENLRNLADRLMTCTLYGIGVAPTSTLMNLLVTFNFGSGGSSEVTSRAYFNPIRSYANGVWMVTATISTPAIEGLTIGTSPYIKFNINQFTSTSVWDFTVVGVKLEYGVNSTYIEPTDIEMERRIAESYFYKMGGSTASPICTVSRETSTRCRGVLQHPEMVKDPTISIIGGTYADLEIVSKTTALAVTAFTTGTATKFNSSILTDHSSSTGYDVGTLRVNTTPSADTYISIDTGY